MVIFKDVYLNGRVFLLMSGGSKLSSLCNNPIKVEQNYEATFFGWINGLDAHRTQSRYRGADATIPTLVLETVVLEQTSR